MGRLLTSVVLACTVVGLLGAQRKQFDVLIRNGRVMDGSGNPWLRADVGIVGGRISSVGRLGGATAATVIDAAERLVTPGFIDVHSHAGEALRTPELRQAQPIVAQGVTTLVINPDGGGPTDLAAQRVELEKGGLGPNVVLLIGHASVRRVVLGATQSRAPTGEELERMRGLVRRAMQDGAFGLSSGLFYTPGSYATTEEVVALASVVGETGGVYTSHIRDEADYNVGVVAAVQEVIRIAEEGHVVGIVSHMKALGPDNWGLSMAATMRIEQARARGVQVFADQYPYEASSTGLRAALMPGDVELPPAAQLEKTVTPGSDEHRSREALYALVRENIRRRGGSASIQIASYTPDRSLEGKTLAQIATQRGVAAEVAAVDLMARGSPSIVSFNMSEEDIRHIMRKPYTMTSSDGGLAPPGAGQPHPRNNGAFARRLAVYVRERGVTTIEEAVRAMTSLPAAVFGLRDRGTIREGAAADVAIFDPALVRDRATYTDPHALAEGMAFVLVNGVPVIADGRFTTALPGHVLRK